MSDIYKLSNIEIVAFVAGELNGATTPVEFDDIALNAYSVAPKRFGWKKHSKHIDLRVVWASLADACKREKGLLVGDAQNGYMLTKKGLTWFEKTKPSRIDFSDKERKGSETYQLDLEKQRLLNTSAFKKYLSKENTEITVLDFQEFARINEYFPKYIVKQRFALIGNSIRGDKDLEGLWKYLREKFQKEFIKDEDKAD